MSIFDRDDDDLEDANFTDDDEAVALTFDSVMCRNGHIRTEANTIVKTTWYGGKMLRCRDCDRAYEERRQETRRKPAGEPRHDAYPEHCIGSGNYVDTGCDLSPSCLACPLPACRYDLVNGGRSSRTLTRSLQAQELRRQGKNIREISWQLGVSRRSVFRLLAAAAPLL